MVQSDWRPLRDRLALGGEDAQFRIDPVARSVQFGIQNHVAAVDEIFGDTITREIERAPFAGLATLGRAILCVD